MAVDGNFGNDFARRSREGHCCHHPFLSLLAPSSAEFSCGVRDRKSEQHGALPCQPLLLALWRQKHTNFRSWQRLKSCLATEVKTGLHLRFLSYKGPRWKHSNKCNKDNALRLREAFRITTSNHRLQSMIGHVAGGQSSTHWLWHVIMYLNCWGIMDVIDILLLSDKNKIQAIGRVDIFMDSREQWLLE